MTLEDELAGMDMLRILKMCLIHDLGEAIHGDARAVGQSQHPNKSEQEKADLLPLTRALDEPQRAGIMALWQAYEDATSPKAKAVKALDKLETLLPHNPGLNRPDFDDAFNLTCGQKHTRVDPLFALMRSLLDDGTRRRIAESGKSSNPQRAGRT